MVVAAADVLDVISGDRPSERSGCIQDLCDAAIVQGGLVIIQSHYGFGNG